MKVLVLALLALLIIGCDQGEPKETASKKTTAEKNNSDTTAGPEKYKVENVKPPKKTEKLEDGTYFEYYPNNQVHIEGKFDENDKKTGLWKSYRVDGQLWSTTEYVNGIRHGESVSYHKNGKMYYKGNYVNGKRAGKWVFYDENGNISNEKTF